MRATAGVLCVALCALCACGQDHRPNTCSVGESRIRRLTPVQYVNTVRDLFDDQSIVVDLHADTDVLISALAVEKYDAAATLLAPRGVQQLAALPECASRDDACAQAFIETFATRAFRHPLREEERAWLTSAFATARATLSFEDSIQVVTNVILTAPQFLYLTATGTAVEDRPALRKLDDYELAARLSYFLWNTLPDDALLAAAAKGELTAGNGEGLRRHAERMLASERTREMAAELVDNWFQLDGGKVHFSIDEAPKDSVLYPQVVPELRVAMRREVDALMQRTLLDGGTIADLFTSTSAYVNGPLAKLYGVTGGPTDADDWQWVELDPNQRAGLLTRAAFATVYSNAKVQSPIRRGVFVLRDVLCYAQPPPPPNVDDRPILGAEGAEALTIRGLTDLRTAGGCQGCHEAINNIGYAFEHYDAIGAYRDREIESGLPIDASASLVHSGSTDGPVADAVAMSHALARSEVVSECLIGRWFDHALRRVPDVLDTCSLEAIRASAGSTGNLRDLLIAIIESEAFRYVNPGEAP